MKQPKPVVEPLVYNMTDAARALGISRQGLYLNVAANKIKRIKIGKRSLIPRSEVARLVEHGTEPED